MVANNTDMPLWVKITYFSMEALIGLFAVVGNMLVIWVIKSNPSLKTTTFYFIVSLALADIAVGIVVIPVAVAISLNISMGFYACLFMCCVLLIFTHASIMSLLAIAVDRYLRVKLTIRSRIQGLPGLRSWSLVRLPGLQSSEGLIVARRSTPDSHRSRIPEVPRFLKSLQLKAHFLPVMKLFILLSLAFFSALTV
ncbi:adenosine receptor A3 isoform X3 [Fukomys damarensis]|uniref:adenosine receptor A3 isoform X3 n=1 Tax=Fukomys damarensis TaxID=885580 RepID=UPI00053F5A47|nr:adenosine receptor A3 isoform X3 [Fukomys damarensis]